MKALSVKERLEDEVASVLAGVQDDLLERLGPLVDELVRERLAGIVQQLGAPPPTRNPRVHGARPSRGAPCKLTPAKPQRRKRRAA